MGKASNGIPAASLAIEIAGIPFYLQVSDETDDGILACWRGFPAFGGPPRFIVAQESPGAFLWGDREAPNQLAASPNSTFSLFNLLVLRILQENLLGHLFLHGNALIHEDRLLLLVGESGAGKSTLSCILEESLGAVPFAEDTLIFDCEAAALLPFPRGRSERSANGKVYHQPPAAAAHKPHALGRAQVFLLRTCEHAAETDAPETAHVTTLPDSIKSWLDTSAFPAFEATPGTSSTRLTFSEPLTPAQRAALAQQLEARGVLLLRCGPDQPKTRKRPPKPSIDAISPSEAIKRLLAAQIRHGAALDAAGQTFIQLAKCLSSSSFFDLLTGGTEEETARLIVDAINA